MLLSCSFRFYLYLDISFLGLLGVIAGNTVLSKSNFEVDIEEDVKDTES